MNNQQVALPGFKNSSGAQGPGQYSLWSFVADCFPTSMATGQAMPQGDSLFSDTYRTPQVVMQYLLDQAPNDHFIAAYLLNRYKKRSWVSGQPGAHYANVSGGATVKNIAVQKHSNAPGWTAVQGASGHSAFTQVVNGSQFRTDAKETIQVKYHGKAGLINKEE